MERQEKSGSVEWHENQVVATAAAATDEEHSLSVKQAFISYWPAVLWSAAICFTMVMEGFDVALVISLLVFPTFSERYGTWVPAAQQYVISTPWVVGLLTASTVGAAIGAIAAGWLVEKFGIRRVIIYGMACLSGMIFAPMFAPNLTVLVIGQLLIGIVLGVFAPIASTYVSEVCPTVIRAYSLSFINACWVVGQLIAAGVLQGLVKNPTQWSYRVPFALMWIWVIPLALLAYCAPESPWWLLRQGRLDEAAVSIRRLMRQPDEEQVARKLAIMTYTNDLECSLNTNTSYRDCFSAMNRWRTEIAIVTLSSQALIGQAFAYNATYFFAQAGLSPGSTYKLNLGSSGIAFVVTFISWWLMAAFGRRMLLIAGYALILVDLLVIACLDFAHNSTAPWVQAGFAIAWLAIFTGFVGPETYTVAAEVSATRVRVKTLALGRNVYFLCSFVCNIAEPYLINPTAANLKGKTGFVWFGVTLLVLVWAIFRLPETKGRTYGELDVLFAKQTSAFHFASQHVETVSDAQDILKGRTEV